MRKQKQKDEERRRKLDAQKKAAGSKPVQPNVIVERAKQNTEEVHRSHMRREQDADVFSGSRRPEEEEGQSAARKGAQMEARIGDGAASTVRTKQAAASANEVQTAFGHPADGEQTAFGHLADERKHFVKEVQELMIKGPDDSIPGQRDFIGEGMEMLQAWYGDVV